MLTTHHTETKLFLVSTVAMVTNKHANLTGDTRLLVVAVSIVFVPAQLVCTAFQGLAHVVLPTAKLGQEH